MKKEQILRELETGADCKFISFKHNISLEEVRVIQHELYHARGEKLIERPIIKKKERQLTYTKEGAFDIPTLLCSVAIDYFSKEITFKHAKRKLLDANNWAAMESDENILSVLNDALKGNERFFEYL